MSEVDWKNKLRKARQAAEEAAPSPTDTDNAKIKFPWFMLATSIIGDLIGWIFVIIAILTVEVGEAVTFPVGNTIEATILTINYFWYAYIHPIGAGTANNDIITRYLTRALTTVFIKWLPLNIGDAIPALTIMTFVHYFKEKSLAKMGPIGEIAQKATATKLAGTTA